MASGGSKRKCVLAFGVPLETVTVSFGVLSTGVEIGVVVFRRSGFPLVFSVFIAELMSMVTQRMDI